jgi:hypothetical protein
MSPPPNSRCGFIGDITELRLPELAALELAPQLAKWLVQLVPAMTRKLFSTGVEQKATTKEIL